MNNLVLHGGTILVRPGQTTNALAIRDGMVIAHGKSALRVMELESENVRKVDLNGHWACPAFGDGHCHPPFAGLEQLGPDIRSQTSVDAIVAEVRRYAEAHPDKPWIVGGGYDSTVAPDGAFDAAWLDEAVPDRPVMLRAFDYHTVWANTLALQRAGIDRNTPDPQLGVIDRRADGSPLGTLREWDACDLVFAVAPDFDEDDQAKAIAHACRLAAREGVTWLQDAWVDDEGHRPYLRCLDKGELVTRFNLAFRADPRRWRDQLAGFERMRTEVQAAGQPDRLSARTVKFFTDGIVESWTAWMIEPYANRCSHGMPIWQASELRAAVEAVDALGFQVHFHAIGDAGTRVALDAIEQAVAINNAWDRRPTITHLQVIDPADLPRMAQLGVIASFQAQWAQCNDDITLLNTPHLGAERAGRQFPIASVLNSGAHVAFATDWPISPDRQIETICVAALRQTPDGLPEGGWIPEERVSMTQAFAATTTGCAYQAYNETILGVLDTGFAADFVILDTDLLAVEPTAARRAKGLATYRDGECIFSASDGSI